MTVQQGLLSVEELAELRSLFVASPVAQVQIQVLTPGITAMDQHCSGSVVRSVLRAESSVTALAPQTTSPVGQRVSATWTSAGSFSTPVGISACTKNSSAAAHVLKTTLSVTIDAALLKDTASAAMNA